MAQSDSQLISLINTLREDILRSGDADVSGFQRQLARLQEEALKRGLDIGGETAPAETEEETPADTPEVPAISTTDEGLVDLSAPGFEASQSPTGTPQLGNTGTQQPVAGQPTTPNIPNLFTPPSLLGGSGGTAGLGTGSSVTLGGGSGDQSDTSGETANISEIAEEVGSDIPSAGNIISDVGASILRTRANIEGLINRKRRVGFSDTRLAAADSSVVARRTLLPGSKASEVQSTTTKKAEDIFKGQSKLATLLGRRK